MQPTPSPLPERRSRHRVGTAILLVLFLLLPAPAPGQTDREPPAAPDPDEHVTGLADLIAQALENNPEYRAALQRVAAAEQRPPQAGSLPDPMLGVVLRNVGFPELTVGEEMMALTGVRATQALPWPGKRPLRREVAREGIDIRSARVEMVRRRVIQEITAAAIELDLTIQSIEIIEETTRLLEEFERTAEARYAVGEGIQQDVFKAQVETSVLINRRVQLEQERDSAITRINRLVGVPVETPIAAVRLPTPPDWDLELASLQEEAATGSAMVEERRQRLEQREATVSLARRERKPDLSVSAAWLTRGDLPDIWEVNVGISLPVRKGQKQDRAVDESLEELEAARHDRQQASDLISEAVQDLYLQADRASRLMHMFETTIIPQATLSLESATSGYTVDKVDFLTVLDNAIALLTYQLQLAEETARYRTALARIEEHLGRSLGITPAGVWRHEAPAPPPDPVAMPAGARSDPDNELTNGGER